MHKKLCIYISIIVLVISLFPSILTAKAEEGGTGDIPGREYSLLNAPFPGNIGKITENSWRRFVQGADERGHTEIKRIAWYALILNNGSRVEFQPTVEIFYSTDGTDIEEKLSFNVGGNKSKIYWAIEYKSLSDTNILKEDQGYKDTGTYIAALFNYEYGDGVTVYPVGFEWYAETWYSQELIDPYQEKPEKYNIDNENNYGMWFKKPSYGEWINIPRNTFSYKDWLEIEIQIPIEYMPSTGEKETLFKVYGDIEKTITPNFVIKMYKNNAGNIYGSYIVGRDGIWIFPKDIKLDKVFKNGSEIVGAKFTAKVPIEHIAPEDRGSSLIVADLYLFQSNNSEQRYEVRIPEARTWTRYHTYVGIVDSDGDGLDDRTGLPIYEDEPEYNIGDEKPNINDYDNTILGRISYYWDTLVYFVKLPFVYIGTLLEGILQWIEESVSTWIDSFIMIFEKLFSFLPREIVVILTLGFSTMMIITIIKVIRGS